MLPTAIKRKLALTIMGALLIGMSLLLATHPPTAFAQTSSPAVSTITIERAFTADATGREKSSFTPGEAIRYVALINNSSGQPTKVVLVMVSAGPAEQQGYKVIYEYGKDITLPLGQSVQYGQSTIPPDAVGGTYVVAAAVDSNLDKKIESKAVGTFTITSGG